MKINCYTSSATVQENFPKFNSWFSDWPILSVVERIESNATESKRKAVQYLKTPYWRTRLILD